MSPSYKLIYFDQRGLGEPIRLTFAYAGISYEDIRHESAKWKPEDKTKYPWGTLPILEVDGKILGQSQAILRYLGKQFKLAGDNAFEEAQCDEMVEAMGDMRKAGEQAYFESDPEKKKELDNKLNSEVLPLFLGNWNKRVEKNGGFLVGKKFSYADFCIASYIEMFNDANGGTTLDKYPALKAHYDSVFQAPGIKEWVAKRPKTFF